MTEVARALGVSRRTINRLVSTGRLRGWRPYPDAMWHVDPASVEALHAAAQMVQS